MLTQNFPIKSCFDISIAHASSVQEGPGSEWPQMKRLKSKRAWYFLGFHVKVLTIEAQAPSSQSSALLSGPYNYPG